uniref:WRKY transcription factor 41 family protein n=1 Tax=Rhizophora mucronata TaxID=61149 RepID=A0A2P2QRE2_RHIMU
MLFHVHSNTFTIFQTLLALQMSFHLGAILRAATHNDCAETRIVKNWKLITWK